MKRVVSVLVLLQTLLNGVWGQMSQWDVYNQIPNYKVIQLYIDLKYVHQRYMYDYDGHNGDMNNKYNKIQMSIFDDYSVRLFYSNLYPCEEKTFDFEMIGTGMICWEKEHMVLHLSIEKKFNGGSYTYPKGAMDVYVPMKETVNYTYDMDYFSRDNQGFFSFKGEDIIANIKTYREHVDGRISSSCRLITIITLTGFHPIREITEKTESETNAEKSDVYGKWQWNDDRSKIYLPSTSNDAHLVLLNNNGNLSWGFSLPERATGYKTEIADSGEKLAYLMLSFDGSSEQSLSFINEDYFIYAQYDRFMGTLKRDASILNQIKDKRILILYYKLDGSDKTAMFQLEGLEAIYNAIM